MKRKIARLLVLSTLILSFYGCASGKADQTYPSYFEPVIQELPPAGRTIVRDILPQDLWMRSVTAVCPTAEGKKTDCLSVTWIMK